MHPCTGERVSVCGRSVSPCTYRYRRAVHPYACTVATVPTYPIPIRTVTVSGLRAPVTVARVHVRPCARDRASPSPWTSAPFGDHGHRSSVLPCHRIRDSLNAREPFVLRTVPSPRRALEGMGVGDFSACMMSVDVCVVPLPSLPQKLGETETTETVRKQKP